MSQPVILVTGSNGQLGTVIQSLSALYPQYQFAFPGRDELPIDHPEKLQLYFKNHAPAFCINCAAYTAVDKAETDQDTAMRINGTAVGDLAAVCKLYHTKLIHISTDYVFDGNATLPYKEDHVTSPVNYYGETKLKGEELCLQNNADSIIVRTSWVYSEYGNNFVKTMMRLMKEKERLNVVNDQMGSPTYAADLAGAILMMIDEAVKDHTRWAPGIYHYSNEGVISWYDFAAAIKNLVKTDCIISPVPTSAYPTAAKRPAYSVMDKKKIQSVFNTSLVQWQSSLTRCISHLQTQ